MKNYYNYIIRNETIYSDVVVYKKIRTYFAQNITYGIPPLASFKILVSDKIVVIFCGWTQFSVKGVERIDCWQMVKTCSFHNRMLSYSKSNESMEFFKQQIDIKDSQWHLFQTCNLKNGSSYIDCNRISFFNMVYVIFEFSIFINTCFVILQSYFCYSINVPCCIFHDILLQVFT